MTALHFAQVSLAIRGRTILAGVELSLGAGGLLALVGPNGAGKSMLLRCAVGLERPTAGRVTLGDADVARLKPPARAARVAWLPQQLAYHEPLSALEIVASARYRFAESRDATHAAARRALADVGAADYAEHDTLTLSGGQRQRVALAALLAQETPVVLLDEPANHLDPLQQIECYRLLGTLVRRGLAVVCVTHDVNLLHHVGVAPRVVGLASGRTQFDVSYTDERLPAHLAALFGVPMAALAAGERRIVVPGL